MPRPAMPAVIAVIVSLDLNNDRNKQYFLDILKLWTSFRCLSGGHLPAAEAGYGKWPFRLACLNICRAGRNATQCILLYIVVTLPSILRKRTEELKLRLVQADGVRDLHVTGGEGLWEKTASRQKRNSKSRRRRRKRGLNACFKDMDSKLLIFIP